MKFKIAAVALSAVFATTLGPLAGFTARADDALYNGINGLRPACGAMADDPHLTAAAQRHANDMLANAVNGHLGSDGSLPQARIAEAGYRASRTGEIVYWGTGSAATRKAALDSWMTSPAHRAIILNCGFTAGGFATAWDGNKMTAVGDFASL